jgi:hypothetical protein
MKHQNIVKTHRDNCVIDFHEKLIQQREYLNRHFKGSFRRWLASKLLGATARANLIYDCADIGWGIGFMAKKNNLDNPFCRPTKELG